MKYEPIKRSLSRFFSGPLVFRKMFYFLIDILLLRAWHVRKEIRSAAAALPSDAAILDAGSGLGQYSWRMASMHEGWHVKGVDIDSEQVADCNRFISRTSKNGRVTFQYADLAAYAEKESYNLILSVDVMEHIPDDEAVFRNFHSSLKEGGLLIISTPSDKGGSDVHHDDDESYIDEHVRNGYSTGEISRKLTEAGFSSVSCRYTYGPAGSAAWRIAMKLPVKMLNISSLFYLVLPFYYLLVLPVCVPLYATDLAGRYNSGTGLIVKAIK